MIRVAVSGATGRMGRQVVSLVTKQPDMEIVAAFAGPQSPYEGSDIGEVAGVGKLSVFVSSIDKIKEELREAKPDVLVDFSVPEGTLQAVRAAADYGVKLVIGTTGFTPEQMSEIEETIRRSGISAVISPNFSIGVNVFWHLLQVAASFLSDYDVEIVEIHHKHKKDAPSGTALKAAELIASVLGRDLEKNAVYGRRGRVGERKPEEIGIHAVRGGDVVGDHTVFFLGDGERIEITHRAHSRLAFAQGVIKAIRFIVSRGEPGRIYGMKDVLGL